VNLPKGWALANVEEIAGADGLVSDGDWIESKDQDASGGVRLTQLADVGEGDFRNRSARYMTIETAHRLNCTFLEPGDVLIARMPDPIGRACIFPDIAQPAVTAVDVMIWRTDNQLGTAEWFVRCINSPSVRSIMASQAGGTTRQRIAGGQVKQMVLPVPPLAEQRRIVAKLDVLTERLARARSELDRLKVLAKRLREVGLESAFSGRLTNGKEAGEIGLPAGWTTVRFDEVAEIASNLVDPEKILDLPHIAPNHIESGRPKLLPYQTIRDDGVISAKHRFYPGQLLYSKIRPYLRKVVQVDFEGGCSADMYPIKPKCHPRYLMYWMLSPQFTWLATQQEGRTVLPKINQVALSAIPTPLAPDKIQIDIAARLNAIFTRADRLEVEAARTRALLDRLEAAILAKAFEGELVPQDPYDEPASVLLDRIRAQRASAPTTKRKPRGGFRITA
jgi:type I restriction enzyme, S subunit